MNYGIKGFGAENDFPRQSLKRFAFCFKLSDSIFFLLGLSPIVKSIWHEKQIFLSILRGKYCLIHLEILKRPKNEIVTLKSYLKQDNFAPHPQTTLSSLN